MRDFFTIGTPSEDGTVRTDRARDLLSACRESKNCEVLETRRWVLRDGSNADIIVADVRSDQVPTKNAVGIQYPERVAFIVPLDVTVQPGVSALRSDFPWTLHQNLVRAGEPRSLCLDERPWAEQELSWTAKKFVQRVVWWLGEVAKGTIHQHDQGLEPPFLGVPSELVIPESLLASERTIEPVVGHIRKRENGGLTFRVMPADVDVKENARKIGYPLVHVLVIRTPAAIHGVYESGTPADLAALEKCLADGGMPFRAAFEDMVWEIAGRDGKSAVDDAVAILASFPRQRSREADPERAYYFAFLVEEPVGKLAEKIGRMAPHGDIYVPIVGGSKNESIDWSTVKLTPLNVIMHMTPATMARLNGVRDMSGTSGILIGTGMLGSQLIDNWARVGWVDWKTVDREHIQPHNLARHTAEDDDIGSMKADVVSRRAGDVYPPYIRPDITAHHIDVTRPKEFETMKEAIGNASVVVDATASARVSRVLGRYDGLHRAMSAFLGPNGESFALLAEDRARSLRLDMLEAQYWRWVIHDEWGEQHMRKAPSTLRYGGGCGDVSATIQNESGVIAGAVLSEQIRAATLTETSTAKVWLRSVESGSVSVKRIPLSPAQRRRFGRWNLVWDDETIGKARRFREIQLPNETGGIILGYADHSAREIYVVDILPPPSDSTESVLHFARGTAGVEQVLAHLHERSAGAVTYLGDWHSHPLGHTAAPSWQDGVLLNGLRDQRRVAGEPTVMLIVGDKDPEWVVDE